MNNERGAIEILEESVNLLRAAPASAHVAYLAGAAPFIVALLFFLNDMTHSPFAADHLAAASLGLAALYIWKNVWQAIFAAQLFEALSPGSGARRRSLPRLIFFQAAIQPLGLVLLLPFPWLVAFFRNAALFAALGAPDPARTARKQAILWTAQNWKILAVTTLAGILVFLNALIAIVLLPQLARSFLGIEGDLARAGTHILNAGTVGAAAAIAWLAIDPLLDAVYTLRCFYGESIATGEDLRAALQRALATVLLLLALASATSRPALAQAVQPSIDPARLDQSIQEVVHRREFTWRTPRAPGPEPEGRWVSWIRSAEDAARRAKNWVVSVIEGLLNPKPQVETAGKGAPVTRRMVELLIALAVALIAGAAAIFFVRRRAPVVTARGVTLAAPAVNLADESVTADQMEESSWLALANEWLGKGDCRLAMRALHLAGLNYLGQRGLVSIRKWKTGLDYRRELERQARSQPEISPVFSNNIALFEQGWYGNHPVTREMVEHFTAGLARIKNHAER